MSKKVTRCRACGAAIEFRRHERTGKWQVYDAGTDEPHWATCTDPKRFRRSHGKGQEELKSDAKRTGKEKEGKAGT